MTRNLLSVNVNGYWIEVLSHGTFKRKVEVKHNGVTVETKKSRDGSGDLVFDVDEDGETVHYSITSNLGSEFNSEFYEVRRNYIPIMRVGGKAIEQNKP
jgi:hypothetical protein